MKEIEKITDGLSNKNDIFALMYFESITGRKELDYENLLNGHNSFNIERELDEFTKMHTFELVDFKNRVDNQEIIEDYNAIIDEYSKLASSLGIESSMDLCIFIQKLFNGGYFSFNKETNFDNDEGKFGPFYLMTGNGVCHNHAAFLKDYLRRNGIYAEVNTGSLFGPQEKKKKVTKAKHATVKINDYGISYLYDLTNKTILFKYDNTYYSTLDSIYLYREPYNSGDQPINDSDFERLLKIYFDSNDRISKIFEDNKDKVEESYNTIFNRINKINNYILSKK